jgi:hypothetical protein
MVLTDGQVEQFRQLYFKRYGREISKEDAYDQGIKLIRLLKRIYKPMTEKQFDAVQRHRVETFPQMLTHLTLHENEDSI